MILSIYMKVFTFMFGCA
uniref:Uncharacterized protein n=1 Tax=Rhizophora mucronata TaxID=61149 RepID=A0A2P2NBI0_RHIMU